MSKVVVLKIEEYDAKILKEKIEDVLFEHFSLQNLFSSKDKVLLKPNLLMGTPPEDAITTHPLVAR